MNLHHTQTLAAVRDRVLRSVAALRVTVATVLGGTAAYRGDFVRRAALFGIAAVAIIGIVVGQASTANSATPTKEAAAVSQPVSVLGLNHSVAHADGPAKAHAKTKAQVKTAALPSKAALLPKRVVGEQSSFNLSAKQWSNAAAIVKAGQDMKLPPRAIVMAVACSMQESTLHNYGHLGANNDHDSLGLFQQRPSSGWGSPKQVADPHHAAQSFYKRLIKIGGWQHLPLTKAVQKVQVSAFPMAYAKWENFAANVVSTTYAHQAKVHAAHAAAALANK